MGIVAPGHQWIPLTVTKFKFSQPEQAAEK